MSEGSSTCREIRLVSSFRRIRMGLFRLLHLNSSVGTTYPRLNENVPPPNVFYDPSHHVHPSYQTFLRTRMLRLKRSLDLLQRLYKASSQRYHHLYFSRRSPGALVPQERGGDVRNLVRLYKVTLTTRGASVLLRPRHLHFPTNDNFTFPFSGRRWGNVQPLLTSLHRCVRRGFIVFNVTRPSSVTRRRFVPRTGLLPSNFPFNNVVDGTIRLGNVIRRPRKLFAVGPTTYHSKTNARPNKVRYNGKARRMLRRVFYPFSPTRHEVIVHSPIKRPYALYPPRKGRTRNIRIKIGSLMSILARRPPSLPFVLQRINVF